jgi:type VI secretion system protein ImpC
MGGRIGFEVELEGSRAARPQRQRDGERRRIYILGDFSGRRGGEAVVPARLVDRRAMVVDLDSFDTVVEQLRPTAMIAPTGGDAFAVEFRSLDDFHPDQLYRRLDAFRALRTSRARLTNPATFDEEAATLLRGGAGPGTTGLPEPAAERTPATGQAELLERLLGSASIVSTQTSRAADVTGALIARLVQPYVVRGPSPTLGAYLSAVDTTTTALMRRVLHDEELQALEARWRGLRRLVETLELGETLELRILDIGKEELLADLQAAQGQPEHSMLHRLLVRRGGDAAGDLAISLFVAHYTFRATRDDLELLAHLGRIGSEVGAPFVAAADPSLLGALRLDAHSDPREWSIDDAKLSERWDALRRSPIAQWIGLALPRVIARLPYGASSDEIDNFAFEELAGNDDHEGYLWGNPAVACAEVIARMLIERAGDSLAQAEGLLEIADLPAHVREVDGEREIKPCAEHLLSLRTGEEILRRGLMPLLSFRDRNAARLMRLQSIADPPARLAGLE